VVSIGYFSGPRLMSALRKRWVRARNPHAKIRFGSGTYLGPGFSLDMPFGGTVVTGKRCEYRRNFRADIGEQAFVGANAVVTRPILPYSFAAGAPARVIEYFGPPEPPPPR
jgi:hypothetical protein